MAAREAAPADAVSIRRKRQAVVDWSLCHATDKLPERSPQYESKLGLSDVSINVGTLSGR